MLMKKTSSNLYQYIKMNAYLNNSYINNSYSLTDNVIRENVKFTAPDILSFDWYVLTAYNLIYLCSNKESNSNVILDSLLRLRVSCQLGGFTQTPIPTPYVDIYSFLADNAIFLRNKEVDGLAIPYLSFVNGEEAIRIPDKYYVTKDSSKYLMIFKDDKFKYIDLNDENGNYRLEYKDSPSVKSIRLSPVSTSSIEYYLIDSGNKCLIKKNNPTFGDYLGLKSTTGYDGCVKIQIELK